MFSPQKVMTFY